MRDNKNMDKKQKRFAYIDGANLHKGVESLGWKLDYRIFHRWMEQKFGVSGVFLFIGLIPHNANLYTSLQKMGYTLVFKEVVYDGDGKAKGNCDADLVLQAAKDVYEHNAISAVLVSSDGDYASLVRFWMDKGVQPFVLSPAGVKKCSILLKRTGAPIAYLDDVKHKLQYRKHKKAPGADESTQGSFS